MKANRREVIAVAGCLGAGVLVALAGLLLAVLPQRSKLSDLNNQLADAQAQFVSLHAVPRHPVTRDASDLFALARAMPDAPDMPGILLGLSRAAAEAKVQLTSVLPSPAPLVQTDGAVAYPMQVVVAGTWDGIAQFLRTLRISARIRGSRLVVNGRLFVVDNVQMTTGTAGAELQATLNVNAFTYGTVVPVTTTSADGTTTTTMTTTTPAPTAGSASAAAAPGSAGS